MAKGEFQKCDSLFSVLSSWVRSCCDDSSYTRAMEWTHRRTSEFHARIGLYRVGVEVIMIGEFLLSEIEDFRHGCQQNDFGGGGLPGGLVVKNLPSNAGDTGSTPWSGNWDLTCLGARKSTHHNWSPCATTTGPMCSGARAPRLEGGSQACNEEPAHYSKRSHKATTKTWYRQKQQQTGGVQFSTSFPVDVKWPRGAADTAASAKARRWDMVQHVCRPLSLK